MRFALFASGAVLALGFPALEAAVDPSTLAEYRAACAKAGKDPDAHVALALWCESHGLDSECTQHLQEAVRVVPDHAKARGLMGLLADRGQWVAPETVEARRLADENEVAKYLAYNARRKEAERPSHNGHRKTRGEAAHAEVALGLWCEQNGLAPEAQAHFTSAVMLDPFNDATWKHLGYVKHGGRWMTKERASAAKREDEAERKAFHEWEPRLKKWRTQADDPKHRADAEAQLAVVTDRHAVAAIARVFDTAKERDQLRAVRLLGQIDDPAATRELAQLAVISQWPGVRQVATEVLRDRSPREFAQGLVALIRTPFTYRVNPVRGPGASGALLVETPRYRILRVYDAPPPFRLVTIKGLHTNRYDDSTEGFAGYDPNGLPIVASKGEMKEFQRHGGVLLEMDLARVEARTAAVIAEARLEAVAAQRRLIADITDIETINNGLRARNQRVSAVLKTAAGAPDLGDDENDWNAWWNDRLGYRYQPPPQVSLGAIDVFPQDSPAIVWSRISCFARGTPVHTREGLRAIESLCVGDQVLSQDVATGALSYRPVLVVHHNSPGATRFIKFDNREMLVASIYHRFWIVGRGWVMARDLTVGERVRFRDGPARIVHVGEGGSQPVYNLDVAESRTFFVGTHGALVHDNSLPDDKLKPFDAPPELAALTPAESPLERPNGRDEKSGTEPGSR